VARKNEFLEYTAASGDWYFSQSHQKYCVFCPDPLGVNPGSGIPKNSPWPTFAIDGLVVADATNDAHMYTAEQVRFRKDVKSGLPSAVSPRLTCAVSTIFFARHHLPERRLCSPLLPIVLSLEKRRVVMPLPARYWPEKLVKWCEQRLKSHRRP